MYMAFQNVHAPIQAPEKYIEKYEFIENRMRRVHAAMADIMDEAVGNITEAFKEAGLVVWRCIIKKIPILWHLKRPFNKPGKKATFNMRHTLKRYF